VVSMDHKACRSDGGQAGGSESFEHWGCLT
jgi:hypothetical protein